MGLQNHICRKSTQRSCVCPTPVGGLGRAFWNAEFVVVRNWRRA